MEIAVKATYAHLVKDESLVQNSDKLYIVEFRFDQSWDCLLYTSPSPRD